jgi:glycosyltransferase involved in cell wall biosynthesis
MPAVQFVIAGGVGDGLKDIELPGNCRLTGAIDEATKLDLLAGADIAINPMFSGSGTNIKMFDFMAAGLPTLTTPVGGRGIETGTEAFVTATRGDFVQQLGALVADEPRRNALSIGARHEAERHYAWEQISPALGRLLHRRHAKKASGSPHPYFSVVVPTFERADSLRRLLDRLAVQAEESFEVIVVDQSAESWPGADLQFAFDLLYVRSDIRGAVRARNLGASLASGDVIAFIDDDCEPSAQWLERARIILSPPDVVGIEGLIKSDRLGDPEWRSVTNEGFSGLGFMTANLLVRRTAFQRLNGFDIAFEEPHFREDTDFGWRLQQLGRVPFSDAAWVFHPPHRRSIERESLPERLALFQKDALLIKKHPDRYRELFFAEAHFKRTPGFARQLLLGAEKHGVKLPDYILERLPNERTIPQRERA